MKFRPFSKIIVFSFFTLFAVNTATCEEEKHDENTVTIPSASISSITMALGIKGEELDPVNPSDLFKPTDTIHAVVRVVDAPANTELSASWIAVDVGNAAEPDSVILTTAVTAEGTRNVDFTLKPSKPFPVGIYRVEISIDGSLDTTKNFMIKL